MSELPFDPLLVAILSPLCAAVLILLAPQRFSAPLAWLGFGLPALLALHTWYHFPSGLGGDYAFASEYGTGLSRFGIALHLGLNGISMPLFALAGIVGLAAGLYALQSGAERLRLYLALLLVMQGGLMGVFASVDVFFFYFFHELALIPTFIMVGIWGGRDRHYAAMKLTIYLTLGAMLTLVGLIAVYVQSGAQSFDLIALRAALTAQPLAETVQHYAFGLLLFGFGILVSLWPLHTWAPLGYGAAPSSAAMLHAGVLKKFGLYGLVQIALPLMPFGAAKWVGLLALLAALGNVLVIGFVTMAQRDLKQMVGYSSVMHMGYAFLGLACLSTVGAGGVVLLMVAHGLSVALMFLLATSVHQRTQTFDMEQMGGLAQRAPVLAAFFVAATMAGIGLPGFANFWGELSIFVALWSFSPVFTVVAVAGIILSAIYGLRAAARVFFGSPTAEFARVAEAQAPADLRWAERVPALLLLAALLFIGFWPKSISEPVNQALSGSWAAAVDAGAPAAAIPFSAPAPVAVDAAAPGARAAAFTAVD
ncbi:complex I subunit 4 family protein [Cephaloticoccus primus]|uniref:complex I subunit 4 family protein n=1 Tax=Cephaloticoccus primus TaxID=1548207 RepID=UPI0009EE666B|nr:NADH-quinone oxidoreductase subunit M [Cephaloticoccus primus]